jgi:hypothetical protein
MDILRMGDTLPVRVRLGKARAGTNPLAQAWTLDFNRS